VNSRGILQSQEGCVKKNERRHRYHQSKAEILLHCSDHSYEAIDRKDSYFMVQTIITKTQTQLTARLYFDKIYPI
jgi:hypothetical protein